MDSFRPDLAEEAIRQMADDPRRCKVGAALCLQNGTIVADHGYKTSAGWKYHAEATVIAAARNRGLSTQGSVLYTTLEPCIEEVRHHLDRACYLLIKDAGIAMVYYGVKDPSREIRGEGTRRLVDLGVVVKPFPASYKRRIVTGMGHWYRSAASALTTKDVIRALRTRRPSHLSSYAGFAVDGAVELAPCPSLRRGWLPGEIKFAHTDHEWEMPAQMRESYELYRTVLHRAKGFAVDNSKVMLLRVPTAFEDTFDEAARNTLELETGLSRYSTGLFYKDVVVADDEARSKLVALIRKQSHTPLEDRESLVQIVFDGAAAGDRRRAKLIKQSLDGHELHFPHDLCAHFVIVSVDQKILLVKRSRHVAHAPGKWALSVEEQAKPEDLEDGRDMSRFVDRALTEELNLKGSRDLKKYCDTSRNVRVLSLFLEQPRLNVSLCVIAYLNVEASEVSENLQNTPGPSQQEYRLTRWLPCRDRSELAKWLVNWPRRYPTHWSTLYRASMAYFSLFGRE